ncbi:MLO-like protein, partial [Psidium guajava]
MAEDYEKERTLEYTATWAVAIVCFVILALSILLEHAIELFEKFLKKRKKGALVEALGKIKSELMLLGFISLLLTVLQSPISNICVPRKMASSWLPCSGGLKGELTTEKYGRRLLEFSEFDGVIRRSLATKGYDKCTGKGKYAFVTAYGIHQLHIFIFVLALFHVLYCLTTLALGSIKMRRWKAWEKETKTQEYKYFHDPERFRYTRDTSFGRRHLNIWSRWRITLWIVCFFRQFFGSVTKVDYMTLRHGFIKAHLPPGSETTFDFQDYIQRSLEDDFKVVVGISPIIWFSAVLFLLTNTHGWRSYIWLPFITLFIVLLVGTKLQVIITKMGLRIQERGNVVKGIPVVQPGDELFWFGRPGLLLLLIHFILFQNAFQLAFFAWATYSFGFKNCFHERTADIVFRVSMGVFVQVLCSYVTLPLYALVTQMGSTMKPTIFNEHVATAVKHWHNTAKKHTKASRHSNPDPSAGSAASSRPMTPARLLNNYTVRSEQSVQEVESEHWHELELTNESAHDREFAEGSEIAGHSDAVEEEQPYPANQPPATAPDHG